MIGTLREYDKMSPSEFIENKIRVSIINSEILDYQTKVNSFDAYLDVAKATLSTQELCNIIINELVSNNITNFKLEDVTSVCLLLYLKNALSNTSIIQSEMPSRYATDINNKHHSYTIIDILKFDYSTIRINQYIKDVKPLRIYNQDWNGYASNVEAFLQKHYDIINHQKVNIDHESASVYYVNVKQDALPLSILTFTKNNLHQAIKVVQTYKSHIKEMSNLANILTHLNGNVLYADGISYTTNEEKKLFIDACLKTSGIPNKNIKFNIHPDVVKQIKTLLNIRTHQQLR